jgi:hypothetical protein
MPCMAPACGTQHDCCPYINSTTHQSVTCSSALTACFILNTCCCPKTTVNDWNLSLCSCNGVASVQHTFRGHFQIQWSTSRISGHACYQLRWRNPARIVQLIVTGSQSFGFARPACIVKNIPAFLGISKHHWAPPDIAGNLQKHNWYLQISLILALPRPKASCDDVK